MIARDGIYIGTFVIHFYGIIIMLGALAAAWLASRQAVRRGENGEIVWDALPWLLVAGILGARIWHILTPSDSLVQMGITTSYYLTHPIDMIDIRRGGLGIPGAVIGGIIALYFYARAKKISFARWVDFIAPGLALAQGVGRWGNFVNQELYGAPTDLPWKLFIDPQHRIAGYQDIEYYHPLFLYESIYNVAIMGFLLFLSRKFQNKLKDGDIFLVYLVLYPVGRFFLEFLRLDPSSVATINANQTVMGVIAILSAVALLFRHLYKRPSPEVSTASEDNPTTKD